MIATVQEMVRENRISSRSGKSQGFHFKSGKFRSLKGVRESEILLVHLNILRT